LIYSYDYLDYMQSKHTQQVTGVSCSMPGIPIGNLELVA
jgi:hypothetical protein